MEYRRYSIKFHQNDSRINSTNHDKENIMKEYVERMIFLSLNRENSII